MPVLSWWFLTLWMFVLSCLGGLSHCECLSCLGGPSTVWMFVLVVFHSVNVCLGGLPQCECLSWWSSTLWMFVSVVRPQCECLSWWSVHSVNVCLGGPSTVWMSCLDGPSHCKYLSCWSLTLWTPVLTWWSPILEHLSWWSLTVWILVLLVSCPVNACLVLVWIPVTGIEMIVVSAAEAEDPDWLRRQRLPAADLHQEHAGSTHAVPGGHPATQSFCEFTHMTHGTGPTGPVTPPHSNRQWRHSADPWPPILNHSLPPQITSLWVHRTGPAYLSYLLPTPTYGSWLVSEDKITSDMCT